jgi:hypothetical protein
MRAYDPMVREWDAILATSLSGDAKQEACLTVLRLYIARIATARLRQPHPALRFYADMIVLAREITPTFGHDDRARLALWRAPSSSGIGCSGIRSCPSRQADSPKGKRPSLRSDGLFDR